MILHDVELDGARVAVRITDGVVSEIAPRIAGDGVDGHGGALLPGLHDHHVHLLATAAAHASIDCSASLEGLREAPGTGWLRGVGASDSVDRYVLDQLAPDRPVRVQHRGGALWMLNSTALAEVARALDDSPDVERDEHGEPTGRLWRYDERIRAVLPDSTPDLTCLGMKLSSYGVTSVTDATPGLTSLPRGLRQRVTFLGRRKLMLRDHDLPTYDELRAQMEALRSDGLPVAVHCVTRESLLLTLAVLDDVGRDPRDRIEHASVVPDPALLLGINVVTQPALVTTRGHDYQRDVEPDDLPHIYRYASLLAAGVSTYPSSDSPYGPLDPWKVMHAASSRDLGPDERVPAEVVLRGFLTDADFTPRRVELGGPADLVLLHCPLSDALHSPDADVVRLAAIDGAWN